ncbi:DUF4153 domain-containing protein [Polaribacter aquimarinus]|nr:DUF4173 domain-containing protein [Polaribacter aquimarinus]
MKTITTLSSALLFSTLFYKQNIGLNLGLFTIFTILVLAITNREKFKKSDTFLKAMCYLITGVTIFFYKSDLTIIANILAFFTLIGSISEHQSSIYIKWVNGIYTTIVSFFSKYYDNLNSEIENVKKEKINYAYWIKIIGIPTVLILVFISLYRKGNPMFDELISKIDFNFINFHWILFTCLGYYLFNNIINPIQIEPITKNDLNQGNILTKNNLKDFSSKKLKEEKQLGVVIMFLLNLLITFFIVTYVMHLLEIHNMLAPELSKQVHSGVNALIMSNILAIIVILYFFRGNLNFLDNNKDLKKLTYGWILLNLIIVVITFIINLEYVISFGLTYKRIGVLFFLTATSVGLVTTFIKVSKIKNLWFLFRKNTQIAFTIIILSSTVNWDKIITFYNINNAAQVDIDYLINLSYNNTFLLKDYSEKNNINKTVKYKIDEKHHDYLCLLKSNSWQETIYDNLKIKK